MPNWPSVATNRPLLPSAEGRNCILPRKEAIASKQSLPSAEGCNCFLLRKESIASSGGTKKSHGLGRHKLTLPTHGLYMPLSSNPALIWSPVNHKPAPYLKNRVVRQEWFGLDPIQIKSFTFRGRPNRNIPNQNKWLPNQNKWLSNQNIPQSNPIQINFSRGGCRRNDCQIKVNDCRIKINDCRIKINDWPIQIKSFSLRVATG